MNKERISKKLFVETNNFEFNTPILFKKKNNKIILKNITHLINDTGETKHYTPATQEWYNSIYSYNSNYIKTLSIADTNIMKLLKSYFNIEIINKVLRTKGLAKRFKRLTTKKLFVGRGDLKHTSSKVIITFFVYNTNKISLVRAAYLCKKSLFFPNINTKNYLNNTKYNKPLKLKEFLTLAEQKEIYTNYIIPYIDLQNQYLNNLEKQRSILIKMVNMKLISEVDKNNTLINLYENIIKINYPEYNIYINMAKNYYLTGLKKFRYLLGFNSVKFSKYFSHRLIDLVKKIYSKNVEFNIININKIHLNTDIYTQAVALKLRNRKNKLHKVLLSSLRKVRLPNIHRVTERVHNFNKEDLLINKIRNNNINSMFDINGKDKLNSLLSKFFPSVNNIKVKIIKRKSISENNISFNDFILRSLKHLNMRGIRVEAKGRLTRRLTASRSVFQLKWRGGLKNIDSSFKGLSTVMLRGHVKSNTNYSFISSKNRNGAFGIKGWISSK